MKTDRLEHYNQELGHLQKLSTEFANIASIEDPHAARLIEALAFLNADIHRKLDEDLSELQHTLMNTLYPHYQTPIPAMGIIQFLPKNNLKSELSQGLTIHSDPAYGETCTFTTCYPLTLLPIEISQATFIDNSLHITLTCPEQITFDSLEPNHLRFFINAPREYASLMYEWLMQHSTRVTLDNTPLEPNCLQPVGFNRHEGMLPYTPRTFMGYRLLIEYFNLPEKFLFFDIKLNNIHWNKTNTANIIFHFQQPQALLEKHLQPTWFKLGCTPIVNLFSQDLEPFKLSYEKTEYQLIPDMRRIHPATEVHTIQRVLGVDQKQQSLEYLPLYGKQHNTNYPLGGYWYAHRRTNMFLSILDPSQRPDMTIHIEALCTNRNLPSELPFGGDEPRLIHEHAYIHSLLPLTPTRTLHQADPVRWQLISHLITHYLSICDGKDGAQNLREILRLYDVNHHNLEGLLHITSKPAIYRSKKSLGNAAQEGIDLTLEIDEHTFGGGNIFLFGCILERFLALYTGINVFTQLTITTIHDKKSYHWPPRAGEKLLD